MDPQRKIVTFLFILMMATVTKEETDGDNEKQTCKIRSIYFYFYNQAGKGIFDIRQTNDGNTLLAQIHLKGRFESWNSNIPLKIIADGYGSNKNNKFSVNMRKAYVQRGYNVIVVDYSLCCFISGYPWMKKKVGKKIAEFIKVLVTGSRYSTYENIHLIGISLGAHIMGIAGAITIKEEEKKISRITGLDPAGPGHQSESKSLDFILDSEDAEFVDIIHTNPVIGIGRNLGTADFWPNGRRIIQPGVCFLHMFNSHFEAARFFTISINDPDAYIAYKCDSWKSFKNGECDGNETVRMGDGCPASAKGIYYLYTNKKCPKVEKKNSENPKVEKNPNPNTIET